MTRARSIPDRIGARPHSAAERKVLARLVAELGVDWVVLHSVGLIRHGVKRWAEADFVVVGPLGIFVLEVKGGRVSREGGLWHFTDRDGHTGTKAEGPFDQAGGGAGALQAYLRGHVHGLRAQVGYGVVMPDVEFAGSGPDVEPEILCDGRTIGASLASFVDRLSEYWTSRLGSCALAPGEVEAIVESIRGDFDAKPSVRGRLRDSEDDLIRYTDEQRRIQAELAESPRMIVRGGAGTGKTLLAIDDAMRLSDGGRRVLFTCHSPRLAASIASELPIGSIEVWPWRELMWSWVTSAGLESEVPDASEHDRWRLFVPEIVTRLADGLEKFDAIVVDEAQDIVRDDHLEIFDRILVGGLGGGTWRVFLDPQQDVHNQQAKAAVSGLASMTDCVRRLSVNCRNTAEIVGTIELLSARPMEWTDVHGVDVEWRYFDSGPMQAVADAIDAQLELGIRPQEVTVLGRGDMHSSGLRSLSQNPRIRLEALSATGHERQSVAYCSVAGFKGLESPVVIYLAPSPLESDLAQTSAYVGGSRATVRLVVVLPTAEQAALTRLSTEYVARRTTELHDAPAPLPRSRQLR